MLMTTCHATKKLLELIPSKWSYLKAPKINTYTHLRYLQDFLKTIIVVIVIKRSYFDTQLLLVVDTNIKI